MERLPWPKLLKDFADKFHWHPNTVLDDTPVCRLWPFLVSDGKGWGRRPYNHGRVRALINRNRLRRGMPPLPETGRDQ